MDSRHTTQCTNCYPQRKFRYEHCIINSKTSKLHIVLITYKEANYMARVACCCLCKFAKHRTPLSIPWLSNYQPTEVLWFRSNFCKGQYRSLKYPWRFKLQLSQPGFWFLFQAHDLPLFSWLDHGSCKILLGSICQRSMFSIEFYCSQWDSQCQDTSLEVG